MSAFGQVVALNSSTATLLFEIVDGVTYANNGYTQAANPTIFKSGASNDPLPLLLIFPATPNIFLGGSGVTNTGAGVGALIPASAIIPYNAIGGDSLYAISASATPSVQILALRQ